MSRNTRRETGEQLKNEGEFFSFGALSEGKMSLLIGVSVSSPLVMCAHLCAKIGTITGTVDFSETATETKEMRCPTKCNSSAPGFIQLTHFARMERKERECRMEIIIHILPGNGNESRNERVSERMRAGC